MMWDKLGLVYEAKGEQPWAQSHAFIPTPLVRDENTIRVYAAFLDKEKVGRIGYVDVDARDPRRVLDVSPQPVLDIGIAGTFDDNGVTPVCVFDHRGKTFLYYVGWQLGIRVRYYLFVGLAISTDGGASFQRYSRTPILDRSDGELFVRTAAHVLVEEGVWKMWYIGGSDWTEVRGKSVPSYTLRYLESADGHNWGKSGRVCLSFASEDEYGFGRPFVLRQDGIYRMWYSIRTISKGYRLGYAESPDGLAWQRMDDQIGIDVSPGGWDAEMMCFGAVVSVHDRTYLFYNGNNYGQSGFGVAVRKS
ncbi:MAG TPA: hypothetical protein VN688_03000 [Gemmataceae bacterium]|nr:hypothetical protein [Gemmataceae bacterium]